MSCGENDCAGASRRDSENGGAGFADQRRRQVARVEPEADGEQRDEYDEADQRPEKSVHGPSLCFLGERRGGRGRRAGARPDTVAAVADGQQSADAISTQPPQIQSTKGLW
jgi:hypothetical protein